MDIGQVKKEVFERQKSSIKLWQDRVKPVTMNVDGIEIIISPKVFEPKPDSVLLARKMIIDLGETVLDTCAGSGIQTVYAAKIRGASSVYSCDINPYAVDNIKLNVKKHNLGKIVKVFRTDLFPKEKILFDVIVANPPYTDYKTSDVVEKSVWDEKHKTLKKFLKGAPEYLKPKGRIYVSWANFADFGLFEKLARDYKYNFRKIASYKDPQEPGVEFRVYELIS